MDAIPTAQSHTNPAPARQESLLPTWRNERAYRVGTLLAKAAIPLSVGAAVVDLIFVDFVVFLTDVLLLLGCCASLYLTSRRRPKRQFVWLPIYVGYWIAITSSLIETGGFQSPLIGMFLALLFVGGVVIQNQVSPMWIFAFTLVNLAFWGLTDGTPSNGAHPMVFIVVLNTICATAIAVGIFAFLQTERNLTLEISRHYEDLFAARASLSREEAANAAKSAFLANVSHELRTPLGAILGYADLIREPDTPDEEKCEYADTIRRNGLQLARLVDDLLDLSKVEAGRIEVEKIEFAPATIFAEVLALLAVTVAKKQIDLKVFYETQVPDRIVSDPMRFKQIVVNVVANAVKFTPKGSVLINVRFDRSADGTDGQLFVAVKDSGIGISQENQHRLFQPFSQVDRANSRRFGGTGLGLNLSRKLARPLGGDLELTSSRPGVGSVFTLSVSANVPASARFVSSFSDNFFGNSNGTAKSTTGPKARQALRGVKVLVVDDSLDNRDLIHRYLASAGAMVETASSGKEGVALARAGEFDVVLMDIQMAEMDGLEATRKLRKYGYSRPILALTAHAMAEDRERSIEAGCNEHLCKPILKSELVAKITSAVENEMALKCT